MLNINWIGDVEGSLLITSEYIIEFKDPWELIPFIKMNISNFSYDELDVLGGLALFMSIREQRASRGPHIIRTAKKRIDSFGLITSAFNEGIENLASKLQPVRSEDGYTLMIFAYNNISKDLETLGWSEAAP